MSLAQDARVDAFLEHRFLEHRFLEHRFLEHRFLEHRALLLSRAYRLVGQAAIAEELVQEAFIRYHSSDNAKVRSPRAFLLSIVTHLALDHLRSGQAHFERGWEGTDSNEPTSAEEGFADPLEQLESATRTFGLLLDRLGAQERAVYILHELWPLSWLPHASGPSRPGS